jgi:hypothetical protein
LEETTLEKQAYKMAEIKLNHKEVGFEGIDWIILAQGEHQ